MTTIFLKSLVAVAVLTASAPILAAPSGSTQKTVLKYDAKTQKYCLNEPAMTGSRIRQTTCKTAVEWSAAGLNMPKTVMLAQK
ncbi:hypothetical protein [Sphingomonas sp. OK281]|uniref:hypothetical protein n=1 Tax=Sphingomonas sp. OK281 TaxID=1881067 RepID=UPI0008F2AF14|nr:hypothetical protein [Sphingomonas sp. OK281]SFO25937.1 hypothetical protein SAMN05428984_3012 [Sphingomonas sp. OK281]